MPVPAEDGKIGLVVCPGSSLIRTFRARLDNLKGNASKGNTVIPQHLSIAIGTFLDFAAIFFSSPWFSFDRADGRALKKKKNGRRQRGRGWNKYGRPELERCWNSDSMV